MFNGVRPPRGFASMTGWGYFSCRDDGVARDFLPGFSGSIWVYLLGCRDEEKMAAGMAGRGKKIAGTADTPRGPPTSPNGRFLSANLMISSLC